MKSYIKYFTFLILCVSFSVCFTSCGEEKKYNLAVEELEIIKSDGSSVKCRCELARKEEERNYGFMNRKTIPEGTGMLFIFDKDQMLRFWMKNTPHPLSIAYINSQGVIKNIYDMTPYSLSDVSSTVSVRYALEVPQGWFSEQGIQVGDKVVTSTGKLLRSL